jgi:3-methyladenine DNA glycosylase AlkD
MKTAALRKMAATHSATQHPPLSKKEVFDLAEMLFRELTNDESAIAVAMLRRIKRQFDEKDVAVFDRWLKSYVINWGMCDDLGISLLGEFFYRFPKLLRQLETWSRSRSVWVKRGACVSLIYSLRRGRELSLAFKIADRLLSDPEDLVQKGYGWMLKEASRKFPAEVFQFVMKRRSDMPRTALRYAIEKLPPAERREAMKK